MSDERHLIEPDAFKSTMEGAEPPAVDPARQFAVVSYVAMLVAAPFIIGHLLLGSLGFPFVTQLFAGVEMPWASALVLGSGWLAGPMLAALDIATFWLLYRLAKRWWIGLLFVPVFIYLMMSAFIGILLYLPLFPLIKLAA